MTLQLFQFSVVVVGQTHNPTILNPDFLWSEGIVPKSWDWEVADTMTTPPLSMVRYDSGITITVELNKLEVADRSVEGGTAKSKATEIAAAYIKTLRHVHYTAVGTNFQSLIQMDSPSTYLIELFLKGGPWNNPERMLDALGLRLIYPLDSGKLTLAIDSGEAKLPDSAENEPVILVNANFNRDCVEHPAYEQVSKILGNAMDDWAMTQQLLEDILTEAR
jgi:hypothetical protein